MKKFLTFLIMILSMGLSACTQASPSKQTTWDTIKETGVLKVATPGTLFPTSYYNDDKVLVGYEVDMLKEIGKRLNIKIEFVEIGVAEAFTAVDSKQVDISVNNLDMTPQRLEKYLFSIPYKFSVGGAIVREDGSSNIALSDLSDWKGKKAGGGAGTQYMKIAQKQGAEPITYDNVTNDVYLRDVSTGRTDFIPNDYFTQVIAVNFLTAKFPDIKVKMADIQYNPTEQGIVMAKDATALKAQLDVVIKDMQTDGTLKAISEKYYGGKDLTQPLSHAKDLPVIDVSDIK